MILILNTNAPFLGLDMFDVNEDLRLRAKYMALAHSSAEIDQLTALELAKQLLKSPIRSTRDLNAKLKILQTEISNLEAINPPSRYRLLEIVSLMTQAEFSVEQGPSFKSSQTKH